MGEGTWRDVVDQLTPEQAAVRTLGAIRRRPGDPAGDGPGNRGRQRDRRRRRVVRRDRRPARRGADLRLADLRRRTWREFDGSTRCVGEATIRVVGRQFGDGTCERWISLSATYDEEFQAAQARELAAALQAIADETERLA